MKIPEPRLLMYCPGCGLQLDSAKAWDEHRVKCLRLVGVVLYRVSLVADSNGIRCTLAKVQVYQEARQNYLGKLKIRTGMGQTMVAMTWVESAEEARGAVPRLKKALHDTYSDYRDKLRKMSFTREALCEKRK